MSDTTEMLQGMADHPSGVGVDPSADDIPPWGDGAATYANAAAEVERTERAVADAMTLAAEGAPPKKAPAKRAPRKTATPKAAVAKADDPFSAPNTVRESGGVERDGYGRYLIPDPETGRKTAWTRATTMAKTISDTYVLSQWGQRMTAKGLMMRPDLRSLVAATPLEDRDTLNRICEDAKNAAGSKVSANLGTAMHGHTEALDKGLVDAAYLATLEELEKADLEAYARALAEEGITILPEYIEKTVVLPEYRLAGTFDRIVRMADGSLRIADLKTGRDLSYGWGEISVQEAIYLKAPLIFDWATRTFSPMPEGLDQKWGLVMHLPVGAGECTLYDVNLEEGWEALELCAKVREWRKKRDLAHIRSKAVARQAVPVTPLDRVGAATSKRELALLWEELKPLGLWTTDVAAAAQSQLSKFATA